MNLTQTREPTAASKQPVRSKRTVAIAACSALALLAAACGSNDAADRPTVRTDEAANPTTEKAPGVDDPATDPTDPADEVTSEATNPTEEGMVSILEAHRDANEFVGGVMAVIDPTGEAVIVTSGTQDLSDNSAPVDPEVPWGIGSITKTFNSVVVLQLAEEGALDLDENIESYFPDLPNADDITIRQLLQHTSGVNEYLASPALLDDAQRKWSPAELIGVAVANGPVGEPGEGFSYSNTNYILLGELIEQVTSNKWDTEVRERILDPLGMTSTTFAPIPAPGFGIENGEFVDYTNRWDLSIGGAAGGMSSTASDLVLYTEALANGTLLNEDTNREMTTFVPATGAELPPGIVYEYGLGLEKWLVGELTVYGHLGSGAAHSAFIAFDPETHTAVVVMLNTEAGGPQAFIAVETLAAALGKDLSLS